MPRFAYSLLLIIVVSINLKAQIIQLGQNYSYLALGDSYTIGQSVSFEERWPSQLVNSLSNISNDTLIYIAQTGWRTDNLINAINNSGLPNDFDLVSLLIGVNNQYQGRSKTVYKNELRQLLNMSIQKAGGDKYKVFVVSIPDYAFTPFGQNSGNAATISAEIDTFNAIKKQLVDSFNIQYFNITPISRQGVQNPNLVASDGLHPSGAQYSAWINLILPAFLTSLEEKIEDESAYIFPNPTTGIINLAKEVRSVKMFDVKGKLVYQSESETLKVKLPTGIYNCEIILLSGKRIREKIIIN